MQKEIYIIYGPPGSGKTTLAILIAEKFNLEHISWGKIYRSKKFKTEKNTVNRSTINTTKNDQVRSILISKVVTKKIKKILLSDEVKGIILEGYPRRKAEVVELVKVLNSFELKIKSIIKINSTLPDTITRIKERVTCPSCGRQYDSTIIPTIVGRCDYDNQKLIHEQHTKVQIADDYYRYLSEVEEAYKVLQPFSETFFNVSDNGNDLITFSDIIIKIKDNIREKNGIYRYRASANLPTKFGVFKIYAYQSRIDYSYHLALVKGDVKDSKGVLTRVHSSCITGDIFHSLKCDCGPQLDTSLQKIAKKEKGVLLYLFQEGRGINIINKVMAYDLQDKGLDTVDANEELGFPAELRQYDVVKSILDDLGVQSIQLLTNNPDKVHKLTDIGVVINGIQHLEVPATEYSKHYLSTKKKRMGHSLIRV